MGAVIIPYGRGKDSVANECRSPVKKSLTVGWTARHKSHKSAARGHYSGRRGAANAHRRPNRAVRGAAMCCAAGGPRGVSWEAHRRRKLSTEDEVGRRHRRLSPAFGRSSSLLRDARAGEPRGDRASHRYRWQGNVVTFQQLQSRPQTSNALARKVPY